MPAKGGSAVYACGRCEIDLVLQKLRVRGVQAQLSSRTFEVLAVLVQAAGELVTKDDFKGGVWAGVSVEENTLQVHISAIRRALGSDRELLRTVSGRGYRLLGNWTSQTGPPADPSAKRDQVQQAYFRGDPALTDESAASPRTPANVITEFAGMSQNLPTRLARVVGCDAAVCTLAEQLTTERFVSLIGPGGIGKTTVAVVIGHTLLEDFSGAVHFVDFGPVRDPSLAVYLVAATLGIVVKTEDPAAGVIAFLRSRKLLLILDGCEHVINVVAALAERIYREAPYVKTLTTSREALRIDGEHVHYLLPLASPPEKTDLTAVETLTFPSVQLFVEKSWPAVDASKLTDADASVVAGLCRSLDGLPLAIEIAATLAAALGVEETAHQFRDQSRFQLKGHRFALPRHRTLGDMLDWSYNLLSENERVVLRRLSVFDDAFVGLKPVLSVAGDDNLDHGDIADAFEGLVAKSLVSTDFDGASPRYRLLNTIRGYAQIKLVNSGEAKRIEELHASYLLLQPSDA